MSDAAALEDFDKELEWIREDERPKIDAIQAQLAELLPGWPDAYAENLRHDIHVCRFLRGHKQDAEKAGAQMLAAVRYRSDFQQQPLVVAMRATMGDDCTHLNLSAIPDSAEVLRCMPFRTVSSGRSANGLPLAAVPVRLVDPKTFVSIAEKVEFFIRCMLEQRAMVLHNLSMQQQRMVKFVELRTSRTGPSQHDRIGRTAQRSPRCACKRRTSRNRAPPRSPALR